MLKVTKIELLKILKKYDGRLLEKKDITRFHAFSLATFADPNDVFDPRIQTTVQHDITEVYKNYLKNYKDAPGGTFTAFIKWISLKAMQNTPFHWRRLNDKWYLFKNLPLEVSVRTGINNELVKFTLENVSESTWKTFCKSHAQIKIQSNHGDFSKKSELPIHYFCHQIVGLHIPRMTSYNTSWRAKYTHQPWLVFSDRYEENKKIYLPLHISVSHATKTPQHIEDFLRLFTRYGNIKPSAVEKIYNEQLK